MLNLCVKPEQIRLLPASASPSQNNGPEDQCPPPPAGGEQPCIDTFAASNNRAQAIQEHKPHAAMRAARVAAGVVSAPLKIVLTPIAGALIGATLTGYSWCGNGMVLGASFFPLLLENGSRTKSNVQQYCENIVILPLSVLAIATGAAVGLGIGAVKGAFEGFSSGIAGGYQASWDNRIPDIYPKARLS